MRRPIAIAVATFAALLQACGGGGADPVDVHAIGDSLQSGEYWNGQHVVRLLPTPSDHQQMLLGPRYLVIDNSKGGQLVAAVTSNWLAQYLLGKPAGIVLFRLGNADAVLGTDPFLYERDLTNRVQLALSMGHRIYIAGTFHSAGVYEPRMAQFDEINARVAEALGATFIPTRRVPPGGLIDNMHADQAYSQAMDAYIVAALK